MSRSEFGGGVVAAFERNATGFVPDDLGGVGDVAQVAAGLEKASGGLPPSLPNMPRPEEEEAMELDRGGDLQNGDFGVGAIRRIVMKNFLTYDYMVVCPEPHLNIIIGPNGTGKSTIISAICLGLGGKPNVLKDGASLSVFVKSGRAEAMIQVELEQPGNERIVFKRIFDTNNRSTYYFQGQKRTQKQIEEQTARLGIFVDNLCQFLPQERVHAFSKMNPQQLLDNTERTVGTGELQTLHVDLTTCSRELKTISAELDRKAKDLMNEEGATNRLEDVINNYRQREDLLKQMEQLKNKRIHVLYRKHGEELEAIKTQVHEEKRKVAQAEAQLQPKQDVIRNLERDANIARDKQKKQQDARRSLIADITKKVDQMGRFDDRLKNIQFEYERKKKEIEDMQKTIADIKRQLDMLERDKASKGIDRDTLNARYMEASQCHRGANNKLMTEEMQVHEMRDAKIQEEMRLRGATTEYAELQSVANKKLDKLKQQHIDSYKACEWLRSNRGNFRGMIHDPIMVTMNVEQPNQAKFIESHLPRRELLAFVCENKQDMNQFILTARQQLGLNVNVIFCQPNVPPGGFKPSIPLDRIRKYGFEAYLSDLVTAPPAVMTFLCNQFRFNTIPVGNSQVDANADRIQKDLPFRLFFSETQRYQIQKSRYRNAPIISIQGLSPANILVTNVASHRLERLGEHLKEIQDNLTRRKEKLEAKERTCGEHRKRVEEARHEMDKCRTELNQFDDSETRIRSKKEHLNRLKTRDTQRELERAESEMKQKLREEGTRMLETFTVITTTAHKMYDPVLELLVVRRAGEVSEREIRERRNALADEKRKVGELKDVLDRKNMELEHKKNKVKELRKAADAAGPEEMMDRGPRGFPENLESIDAKYTEIESQVMFMTNSMDGMDRVVAEFNERKAKIDKLRSTTDSLQQEMTRLTSEIAEKKERWLPQLKELVGKINERFERYFRMMGCAGEVQLSEKDEDFGAYGIVIQVKFRHDQEIQELRHWKQSGGERTVTTALYVFSLQELTKVPFRCLDEINQGMDEGNERKIIEILMQVSAKDDAAQYFMVTPKLLYDMKYTDNVGVFTIDSGAEVRLMNSTPWFDIDAYIERKLDNDEEMSD